MAGRIDVLAPVRGLSLRRRSRGGAGLAPAVLVVTSRHRLWQRYGSDGVAAVEQAVGDLGEAMAGRGLACTLVYADDSPLVTCLGLLPADVRRADSVAQLIRSVAARLSWTEESARYVLILGDDGVVPFHRLPNPSPDSDEVVLSDHPYAADPDDALTPVRAVGRIPDTGLTGLIDAIGAAAAAHRGLAAAKAAPLRDGACGYSASIWKGAARAVYSAIGAAHDVRLSPPLSHEVYAVPGEDGPRFRYFNLHGLSDSPDWFGQRHPSFPADYAPFPVALRAKDMRRAPGSAVFSEACYGAYIQGRATDESVALACIAGGALAFVGATGVAYGGLDDGPLFSADMLARRFWQALKRGLAAGEALSYAKQGLVKSALLTQGYLDAEDEKAIYNFVLYGDPSLTHQRSSARASGAAGEAGQGDAVEWAGPADSVGTRPVRPNHSISHDAATPCAVPGTLVEHVRKLVARQLPEFATPDVTVDVTPAAGNAVAKDLACSPVARAGNALVVTLRRDVCYCEGPSCSEIVRVTVDRGGRVMKIAVTR